MESTRMQSGQPVEKSDGLLRALENLLGRLNETALPLEIAGVASHRSELTSVREQLADYLIPRARHLDAPLLAVVGGSTGAGKSTLVNSLLGHEVTTPGVLRPTTRWPVLIHHPDDAASFQDDRILPGLARMAKPDTAQADGAGESSSRVVRLVADEALPQGLAILDAPDIDSVVESNRVLATQLLAAADLWIFVTTAARYADAVPWELLRVSARRGTTVAMVLDRVPAAASRQVRHHLSEMLVDADLAATPLFTIPETTLADGLLPEATVFPVKSWIMNLGRNPRARSLVVRRTLDGALATVPASVEAIAIAAAGQHSAWVELQAAVDEEFGQATDRLTESLLDGRVLRGEVLARWQDFVGTGQFFRGIEATVSRLRDRITAAIGGKRDTAEPLGEAINSGVSVLVREQAIEAHADAARRWRQRPDGAALLEGATGAGTLSAEFDRELSRTLHQWHDYVNELVREEGQGKRAKARILSFGVNGVGVVLMLVVFAGTGGVTGAEAGIAGGTALVAQRLLEAIFGDQVMRELAGKARKDLESRVAAVLKRERSPFDEALAAVDVPSRTATKLRDAGTRLEGEL